MTLRAHTRTMPSRRVAQRNGVRRAGLGLATLVFVSALTACDADGSHQDATRGRSQGRSTAGTTHAARLSRGVLPRPAVAGTNRRLASAAAARMIASFPVPPGARRVDAAPSHAGYLRQLRAIYGPVDSSLTRTRWWIVPQGYHRLIGCYVARTSADRRSTQYGSGRTATQATLVWGTRGPATAYSPPAMVVTYSRLTRRSTAIRTDVTLAARDDRTAPTLVPATVSRIEVTRQAIDGPDASPGTVSVMDQGELNAVIAAFDRVPGEYRSTEPSGCGSPVGIVYLYSVTFHWPQHTLVASTGQPLCEVGRKLTRDDVVLRERLDPESPLDEVLKSAYDHPRG